MVAALRVPKVRWGIGVLLGAGVLGNYFDRVNLSVAAPQTQHESLLSDRRLTCCIRATGVRASCKPSWAHRSVTAAAYHTWAHASDDQRIRGSEDQRIRGTEPTSILLRPAVARR
jgi:hypothetical protein